MSKYSDAMYNCKMRLAHKARDVYSRARIYSLPDSRIIELKKELYESKEWQKASGYVHSYIRGMFDLLFDLHFQFLEFGYEQTDGTIKTTDELRELYPDTWIHYCDNGHGYFYPDDRRTRF